jgi:hypothetical protein
MLINIRLVADGFGVDCKLRIAFVALCIYFAFLTDFYFDTHVDSGAFLLVRNVKIGLLLATY